MTPPSPTGQNDSAEPNWSNKLNWSKLAELVKPGSACSIWFGMLHLVRHSASGSACCVWFGMLRLVRHGPYGDCFRAGAHAASGVTWHISLYKSLQSRHTASGVTSHISLYKSHQSRQSQQSRQSHQSRRVHQLLQGTA
jgi:hypothetical protein